MSLLSKVTKFGLAKKVFDEVRKPENQERVRRLATVAVSRGKTMTSRGKTPTQAPTFAAPTSSPADTAGVGPTSRGRAAAPPRAATPPAAGPQPADR